FYTFSIIFIWNSLYYINNKSKLSTRYLYSKMDLNLFTKIDLCFYITRILFWGWLIVGLFGSMNIYFLIL
ncbi:MAG: hypothetical protein AABY22_06305, partial [Nanoarchaeota archaeon]